MLLATGAYARSASNTLSADSATARELLAAHNQERARVGVAPLAWSNDLAAIAQHWAEALIKSGAFVHSGRYGENLYDITGGGSWPARVVGAWSAEADNYDPAENRCVRGMCGHYTQVVWSRTRFVGCGMARDATRRREVWACNYEPYGNIIGERPFEIVPEARSANPDRE